MRGAIFLALVLAAVACKPPPTDADMAGGQGADAQGPSAPLDSPDSEGALWADSRAAGRILYGKPGEPPLLALACDTSGNAPAIRITRFAPADRGAAAFAALIGNGHVARIPMDATEIDGASVWFAQLGAAHPDLDVLTGRREVAMTVPGAGRLVLNPSTRPGELIEACRAQGEDAPLSAPGAPDQ